jgi:hypothetical protein
MSEFARMTGILFDPKPAFADIAARPRWWAPMVLLIVLAMGFTFAYSQRVGWERFMRQTIESSPRTQNLTVEQREQAIAMQTKIASIFGYVGAAVAIPIYMLVVAGVMLLVFNTMLSAGLRFRKVFGITCYASLTGVVGTALAILVMFLKNPEDFNLRNPTAFNVGAFLDPQTTPKWLQAAGGSLDLFTIWTILLLATGLSVAARKVSWGSALAAVIGPWIVWIAVKSIWASLFG